MFSNCGNQTAIKLSYCGALIFDVVLQLNLTNVIVQNSTGYGITYLVTHLLQIQFSSITELLRIVLEETL